MANITNNSVLFVQSNGVIYEYDCGTNTATYLGNTGNGGFDVAMSNSKLWIGNAPAINEFSITMAPFTIALSRSIALPSRKSPDYPGYTFYDGGFFGAGLTSKPDGSLIMAGYQISNLNITATTASVTGLFYLPESTFPGDPPSNASVTGDIYYNSNANTYIVLYSKATDGVVNSYVGEFTATGILLNETMLPFNKGSYFGDAYAIFASGSTAYIARNNYEIWKINRDFSVTYLQTAPITGSAGIYGAAQIPSYQNAYYFNYLTSSVPYSLGFQAESTIYQTEVRCHVNENDFNYTLNPSAIQNGTSGSYIDAVTGSDFHPYATTVGLYNDTDELLVVGKLSTPYPIPSNTDMTFIIRWDS